MIFRMSKRNNDNRSIADALSEFVSSNKLEKGLQQVQVRDVWSREMGPAIEKYTTALKYEREVLYVSLSSSVLREELSYGKEKIVRMLNDALGKDLIKKLVLR